MLPMSDKIPSHEIKQKNYCPVVSDLYFHSPLYSDKTFISSIYNLDSRTILFPLIYSLLNRILYKGVLRVGEWNHRIETPQRRGGSLPTFDLC